MTCLCRKRQPDRLNELLKIRTLEEMPMRYRLYGEEPWHSHGLRFFPVDNYLVFYLLDEPKKTVSIVRIMYCGRDVSKQLS